MNLNDLWIGDQVLIKASGKSGKYAGKNDDGRARVVSNGKTILVLAKDLEVISEKEFEHETVEDLINDKNQVKSHELKTSIDNFLDLHIEKLAPYLLNENPSQILGFQKKKCLSFIKNAIDKNYPVITIIHGIGEGVLKSEIDNLLHQFPQIRFKHAINNGGAMEVWLG